MLENVDEERHMNTTPAIEAREYNLLENVEQVTRVLDTLDVSLHCVKCIMETLSRVYTNTPFLVCTNHTACAEEIMRRRWEGSFITPTRACA